MIDLWKIQQQCRTKLLAVTGIPGEDHRAWENRSFTPETGEPWIRETLLPGDERIVANNEIEATGLYQVDYFVPIGHSIKDARNVADAIKQAFKPTTVLGGLVRIERTIVLPGTRGISGLVAESGSSPWYHLLVQMDYTAFSTND